MRYAIIGLENQFLVFLERAFYTGFTCLFVASNGKCDDGEIILVKCVSRNHRTAYCKVPRAGRITSVSVFRRLSSQTCLPWGHRHEPHNFVTGQDGCYGYSSHKFWAGRGCGFIALVCFVGK